MPPTSLKPAALTAGDRIGVVSPASPMVPEKLEAGLHYLKQCGYDVILGKHIHAARGYLAGSDDERIEDLLAFVADPGIKAIFSSRGGYGTPRLLDRVNYTLFKQHPKILMGYSDLTALQLAIWHHTRLITFSGPMVAVEMANQIEATTAASMWSTLDGSLAPGSLALFPQESWQIRVPGHGRGPLLGGCLSLIASLLGTPHQPDFSGAILVLEDVGEEPYRIDRYLSQLRLAGVFRDLQGVILAQFLDCEVEPDKPSLTIAEVLQDYFDNLKVPVISGFQYGHSATKHTLPLGALVEIDTAEPSIRFCESAVTP